MKQRLFSSRHEFPGRDRTGKHPDKEKFSYEYYNPIVRIFLFQFQYRFESSILQATDMIGVACLVSGVLHKVANEHDGMDRLHPGPLTNLHATGSAGSTENGRLTIGD